MYEIVKNKIKEKRMRSRFLMMLVAVFLTVSSMFAASVSQKQVEGWLNLDDKPLNSVVYSGSVFQTEN